MPNYLTDELGRLVRPQRPLAVDDVSVSHDRISGLTETITFKTGAAGLAGIVALDKGPIASLLGDRVGSFWDDSENLVLDSRKEGANEIQVTAVVETAASATVTINDPIHDLSQLLPPTGSTGEFVIRLTDASNDQLYGWVNAVAKSGDLYTIDVYNSPALSTQSWVGTLANFTFEANKTKFEIFQNSSSFSWTTGTILTREVRFKPEIDDLVQLSGFSNGDFAIDYPRGRVLYKKATTGTSDTANYTIRADSVVVTTTTGGSDSIADDAAFTVATTPVTPAGFLADETSPDSVNEGDAGAARMTLDRRQITAGQSTDDATPETGTRVNVIGGLADETSPDSVDEGDVGYARMTLTRKLYTAADQVHDDAVAGHASLQGLEAKDFDGSALPNAVGTEGDAVRASGSLYGIQYVMAVNEDGSAQGTVTAAQTTHDNLNSNANLQVGDADVSATNGVPVTAEDVSNGNTSAYAASLVIKASAGKAWEIRGFNSGAAQWIQVHDAASLPADTAVPEDIVYVGANQNFSLTYPRGKSFATGIVVCNSSTGPTKTVGSANCWFSAEYE